MEERSVSSNSEKKSENRSLNVVRPFGPSIASLKMPGDLIEALNQRIDDVWNDKNFQKQANHGDRLIGNVTQEFRIDKDTVQSSGFLQFLAEAVKQWILATNKKTITTFEALDVWTVRQFEGEYNPTHWHSGHISGVGYLKVPTEMGSTVQSNKATNRNGCIDFIYGNRTFLSPSVVTVRPKIGDFYLFPNYLMHTVYPFSGDGERRSISFNAKIDDEIYHDFG